MHGFLHFVREQGIAGFAIGFIVGGGVNRVVTSLVNDVLNPLIGLVFGNIEGLADMTIGVVRLGSFVSNLLNFLILAFVIYFIFKKLGLTKLDVKKEG